MKSCNSIVGLLLVGAAVLWPGAVMAQDGLVALVTEETVEPAGVQQAFWWQSASVPDWTPTDVELRAALRSAGVAMADPAESGSLSKIYRRPAPSDANAVAMATVFGHARALVGTIRYEPHALTPLGLAGWKTTAQLRLVEKTAAGVAVVRSIAIERSRWANGDDEARAALRGEVAGAVATLVAASLKRNVGPVGLDEEELMIGIAGPSKRAALDAVRAKLVSFAGVADVRERWAAQGVIVMEVNPGARDPRASVEQYITLLKSEGAGAWTVQTRQSSWPNVVLLELTERGP